MNKRQVILDDDELRSLINALDLQSLTFTENQYQAGIERNVRLRDRLTGALIEQHTPGD